MNAIGSFVRLTTAYSRTAHIAVFKLALCEQPFPCFIAIHQRNLVPTFDPRLQYTLEVEQSERPPVVLDELERRKQAKGTKRLQPREAGTAPSFTLLRIIAVGAARRDLTGKELRMAVPHKWRRGITAKAATNCAIRTFADAVAFCGNFPDLSKRGVGLVLELVADAFMPPEYRELAQCSAARPGDLIQCTYPELLAIADFVAGKPRAQLPSCTRWLHALPSLEVTHAFRALDESPLDGPLAYARATRSTVFSPFPDSDRALVAADLAYATQLGAIVERGDRYSLARDARDELWVADYLSACKTTSIPACGRVLELLPGKLAGYVLDDLHVVAPTPGHAAALSLDALSTGDVCAGRYQPGQRKSGVCFVFAHLFGWRTARAVLARLQPTRVICVGDPTFAYGSGQPGDAGCLMRDVTAALRRQRLPGIIDLLFGYTGCTAGGCITADEHELLRSRTPTWPAATTLIDAPADLTLIATHKRGKDCSTEWITLPELGLVIHATAAVRTYSAQDPRRLAYTGATDTLLDFGYDLPGPWEHTACCGHQGIFPREHGGYVAQTVSDVARAATGPIVDVLRVMCQPETGIEDVRAACLLARKRVIFVNATDATLMHHCKRPSTGFLEACLAPRALLPTPLPNVPVEFNQTWHLLGLATSSTPRRTTIGGLTGSAAAYLHDHEEALADNEYSPSDVYIFLVEDAEPQRLTALTYAEIEHHVVARLAALRQHTPGLPESALPSQLATHLYPPATPEFAALLAADPDPTFRVRRRETMAIFLLAKTVKGTPYEAWLPRAEHRLFTERGGDAAGAELHSDAIAMFIGATTPLREAASIDEAHTILTHLWEVRGGSAPHTPAGSARE